MQSYKDLFILTELPIIWIIIWSDNIFSIEINGAFAIYIIVYNLQLQNQKRLKFSIYASYVDIYLLMS